MTTLKDRFGGDIGGSDNDRGGMGEGDRNGGRSYGRLLAGNERSENVVSAEGRIVIIWRGPRYRLASSKSLTPSWAFGAFGLASSPDTRSLRLSSLRCSIPCLSRLSLGCNVSPEGVLISVMFYDLYSQHEVTRSTARVCINVKFVVRPDSPVSGVCRKETRRWQNGYTGGLLWRF
jgi:hypothetical protein